MEGSKNTFYKYPVGQMRYFHICMLTNGQWTRRVFQPSLQDLLSQDANNVTRLTDWILLTNTWSLVTLAYLPGMRALTYTSGCPR